jgi:hypothetical protein
MKLDYIIPFTQYLSNAQKIELARIMLKEVRGYYDDNYNDTNNYASRSDDLAVVVDALENYFINL